MQVRLLRNTASIAIFIVAFISASVRCVAADSNVKLAGGGMTFWCNQNSPQQSPSEGSASIKKSSPLLDKKQREISIPKAKKSIKKRIRGLKVKIKSKGRSSSKLRTKLTELKLLTRLIQACNSGSLSEPVDNGTETLYGVVESGGQFDLLLPVGETLPLGIQNNLVSTPSKGEVTDIEGGFRYAANSESKGFDSFSVLWRESSNSFAIKRVNLFVFDSAALTTPVTVAAGAENQIQPLQGYTPSPLVKVEISRAALKGDSTANERFLTYAVNTGVASNDSLGFKIDYSGAKSNEFNLLLEINERPQVSSAAIQKVLNRETGHEAKLTFALPALDQDGDSLTAELVTPTQNGIVDISGTTATYTPAGSFVGYDSFEYKLSDGKHESTTQLVELFITPIQEATYVPYITSYVSSMKDLVKSVIPQISGIFPRMTAPQYAGAYTNPNSAKNFFDPEGDPANSIAKLGEEYGVKYLPGFWTHDLISRMEKYGDIWQSPSCLCKNSNYTQSQSGCSNYDSLPSCTPTHALNHPMNPGALLDPDYWDAMIELATTIATAANQHQVYWDAEFSTWQFKDNADFWTDANLAIIREQLERTLLELGRRGIFLMAYHPWANPSVASMRRIAAGFFLPHDTEYSDDIVRTVEIMAPTPYFRVASWTIPTPTSILDGYANLGFPQERLNYGFMSNHAGTVGYTPAQFVDFLAANPDGDISRTWYFTNISLALTNAQLFNSLLGN